MNTHATVSIPAELIPEISEIGKAQHISTNKAISLLVEIGLNRYREMSDDEKSNLPQSDR